MARIIAGGKVTVHMWQTPPDAEVLGMDGKQVWYGGPDGLGSTVARDVSHCFRPESVAFEASPADEVVHVIADGEAVTSCCGRTPFELPRWDRITVDPKLGRGCG